MKIDSLKDLQKLIAVCRKTGVDSIKVDGIEMHLGQVPKAANKTLIEAFPEANIKIPQYTPMVSPNVQDLVADTIKTDELTQEELLFYSARDEMIVGKN